MSLSACPNCSNTLNNTLFRCSKCKKVSCSRCWTGRCPHCDSTGARNVLGAIGK